MTHLLKLTHIDGGKSFTVPFPTHESMLFAWGFYGKAAWRAEGSEPLEEPFDPIGENVPLLLNSTDGWQKAEDTPKLWGRSTKVPNTGEWELFLS